MDDYGYASLSYIYTEPGVSGSHFTFAQFIDYFKMHYNVASGRIPAQSLASLILSAGLWFARIAQCVVITFLLFTIYKIIIRYSGAKKYQAALVVCCLYGLLEIFMFDRSIFWFSAATTYLWALLPFFYGCFMYYKYVMEKEKIGRLQKVLIFICLLFSATAHEQTAVTQIFMLGVLFIVKLIKTKKTGLFDILLLLCSVAGLLIICLSPASQVRIDELKTEPSFFAFTQMSIPQKISFGYTVILQYLFSKNFFLFIIAFLFCGSYVGYRLFREKRGIRILNAALILFGMASAAVMIGSNDGLYTLLMQYGVHIKVVYLYLTALLALSVYGFTAYYWKSNKKFMLLAFWGAIISIACVVVAIIPSIGRLYIPLVFLLFVPMGDIACEMVVSVRSKQIKFAAFALVMLVVCFNMINYTYRFYKVSGLQIENRDRLLEIADMAKNGEDLGVVYVYSFPNIESDALMPTEGILLIYRAGSVASIKEYYDIPQSVDLRFEAKP